MRLYRLTLLTIFRRKEWAVCALAVAVLPFVLPLVSSASEKPVLVEPARVVAAWSLLWLSTLCWGLFAAARQGEANARSGVGEYFLTTGVSATRQLFEIWLAVFSYIVPLAVVTAAICLFAAAPHNPGERAMWWYLNAQYVTLFLLVVGPLLALAIAISSRFGGIAGFAFTLFLALYGLYGVGYLENMLKLEENPFLRALWLASPHYHFADLTCHLEGKWGALTTAGFARVLAYLGGIFAVWTAISRLCFRTKSA